MTEEPSTRIVLWTRKTPAIASGMVILMGTTVLVGWALNLRILTSFFPQQTSMRPNSAVAYILAGFSLWILQEANGYRPARLWRSVGQTSAVLVAALGALPLSE